VIRCISLTNLPSQYGDLVALRLLLPLDPNVLTTDPGATDALCLQHCERILESSELYWKLCASSNRSIMCIYPVYHAAAVVLTQIEEHRHQAYSLFERACSLMDEHMDQYPIAPYLVRALEVIAQNVGLPLSGGVLSIFRKSSLATCDTTDVLVTFVLPAPLEMLKLIQAEREPGTSQMGIKVEDLISKRSGLEL
jgi:hypothetical protein